ncbi:MAG TPA: PEP-CTERM sorting domain-containing protein [Bryobacteraceae bacterium]|nr:PEP-CTERM sorting domain-containing protein [Bryobacteraceae bacterium]
MRRTAFSFHPRSIVQVIAIGLCALCSSVPVRATIISGDVTGGSALGAGGTFVKLTVPLNNPFGPANSVGNDTFQSPNLFGFDEDQNIIISAPLQVDVGSGPLTPGTTVASHYIFFDPGPSEQVIGTVTFDAPVLAVFTTTNNLAASDFLANTGVNYLNPDERGLEPGDSVTISGTNQITFDTFASSPGDYVRVLTAFSPGATSTPEPGPAFLLFLGLAAILALRRWRPRVN